MNQGGYTPKNLAFDADARAKLISGITKLSKAVKSTLGPQGQTVLIESQDHLGGITVTKDGVTVARSIDMLDPVENLAVRVVKQAAAKTALDAGDGTTTSIVLAEAIVNEIIWEVENSDIGLNKTILLNEITSLTNEYVKYLDRKSIKVNDNKLEAVARISANNDKELGKIISDAYKKVGLNGVVTVENSLDEKTYADITEGFKLDRGYSSNLFINNQEKDECIFEDCHVLVCDQQIDNIFQIENVLKPIVKNQHKLLVIAPCSTNMINTLAANVVKSNVRMCVVQPPNFGWKSHELMEDIAMSLGATYFSEKTGDDLALIGIDDLGKAKKVIIGSGSSVIIKEDNINEEAINERVEQLRIQEKQAKTKATKDHVVNRIASLIGGIGVIKVGGLTDTEQKEKFDRVEDAVCAVRAALEEGILPGGGVALYNFDVLYHLTHWGNKKPTSAEAFAAGNVLSRALKKPFETIMRNAGCDGEELADMSTDIKTGKWSTDGYDAKTKKKCHLIAKGIIDPTKVTKSALLNAVSVATTIMSTNAIVTLARTYEST